jgi:hypothetical protein
LILDRRRTLNVIALALSRQSRLTVFLILYF